MLDEAELENFLLVLDSNESIDLFVNQDDLNEYLDKLRIPSLWSAGETSIPGLTIIDSEVLYGFFREIIKVQLFHLSIKETMNIIFIVYGQFHDEQ